MTRPVVLFACVHNGGRSLAAKVLAEHHGGDRVEVRSAGSEPGDALNPAVGALEVGRWVLVSGPRPEASSLVSIGVAVVLAWLGVVVFQRSSRSFADVI